MKVLLCHNYYRQPGGEDAEFLAQKELLTIFGHQVLEYVRRNDEIRLEGLVAKATLGLRTIWADDSSREIRALVQREKPDVVHFHNTFPLVSMAAYYPCREAGVPVIQTVHNYRLFCPAASFFRDGRICEECVEYSLWRGVQHKCYRQSQSATATVALMLAIHRRLKTLIEVVDAYIAPTQFVRRKLVELGLSENKISVKPNLLHPDPGVRPRTGEYAIFVGRLVPEKGVLTLLRAFKHLRNAIPLRIVGDGPLRSEMEALRNHENLSNVQFEGWLPRQQTLEIMGRARFLIFPSEWSEPFGMTILESFACGVPVITTRLGGPAEIVEEGKTGVYFTTGDANDLAGKVQHAWDHQSEMALMGRAARAEYEAKYAALSNYMLLMNIYDRAISAKVEVGP